MSKIIEYDKTNKSVTVKGPAASIVAGAGIGAIIALPILLIKRIRDKKKNK